MNTTYPYTIENSQGERLTFLGVVREPDGDKLLGENFVAPGSGPPMHVHWLQEECFMVVKGTIGYQIQGQPEQFAGVGETILFKRGEAHRFWNAGTDTLQCTAWVKPANTLVFYLSAIFAAQRKAGSLRPELFDAAYLLTRYASEYDMIDMPRFVRRVVIPIVYAAGKLLKKYDHFSDAPAPVIAN